MLDAAQLYALDVEGYCVFRGCATLAGGPGVKR